MRGSTEKLIGDRSIEAKEGLVDRINLYVGS